MLRTLLRLQELDLQIEACRAREAEIPKQKGKFEVQRQRLSEELEEREQACKQRAVEQRQLESEIAEKQAHIDKYQQQLLAVKKNEEYQALLHEIELLKKQIAGHEERVITLMVDLDDANARLEEDTKRINDELAGIDRQCAQVDAELKEAIRHRASLEEERVPVVDKVDPELMARYLRIRDSKKTGAAVVPLREDVCSGCNVIVPAQIVNEVLAGKLHACPQCGRIIYETANAETQSAEPAGGTV